MNNECRERMKILGMVSILGFLFWFQSVEAAQYGLPFVTEDGNDISVTISILDQETEGQVLSEDGDISATTSVLEQETEGQVRLEDIDYNDAVTSILEQETEGVVQQKSNDKGSAGKTSTQETMENLNMYDDLTSMEKQILYKVVSMECDTGYEGSLAVISCMMNRTQSDKYSDDLMEVVTEDSQFTAYYDKETGTYPYVDREPSEECIAAVEDALYKGKRNLPSYILYFRSSDYQTLPGYERYGQIGDNTYFYLSEDVD